jgi:hypothetical protein
MIHQLETRRSIDTLALALFKRALVKVVDGLQPCLSMHDFAGP